MYVKIGLHPLLMVVLYPLMEVCTIHSFVSGCFSVSCILKCHWMYMYIKRCEYKVLHSKCGSSTQIGLFCSVLQQFRHLFAMTFEEVSNVSG